jgi:DNA-binding SARP family transcriptional activator/pimeloyl-ACP methyl ester carboxylesterase
MVVRDHVGALPVTRQTVVVRMLGPLEVRVGGSRLGPRDLGGVKPKQLLEVLLLERGRLVAKDRIGELLWGEELPQRVAATIETYVSVLRRRLDSSLGSGGRLILTEPGGYRLAADEVAVDVDHYEALLRRAAAGGAADRRSALDAAVELGRLELLADEPYAAWVVPTREHYRERQVQALVDLAECCLDLGDHRAAVAAAEGALRLEPTRERASRAAMLARHTAGDRDGALRVYERCRAALSDELGVAPTAETATLHAAMVREETVTARARNPIAYAHNRSVRIAYQVVGEGRLDLVFSPSHVSNLGAAWDDPTYAAFLRRLASMVRLILFDKRGTGLSDPALDFPTTRERSEDLVAVLDAAGSPRAVLFGVCGGGALCAQLAADHPDRAAALILHNSMARVLTAEDYPWGLKPELYARLLDGLDEAWMGNGDGLVRRNPGLADNPRYRDWFARYLRLASNPWMARRLAEMNAELDVRAVLAQIRAPTLIICRTDDAWLSPENSRYLARQIKGARLVELPGVDHDPWVGDTEAVLRVVERFLGTLASTHRAVGPTAASAP